MTDDSEKGSFSTEIPDAVLAEAVAAVERNARGGAPSAVRVEVEAAPEALAGDPSRDELVARVSALEALLAEEHGRLLRVAADAENYKKRALRERDELQRYGIERLVKELLPVFDSLDRALGAGASGESVQAGVELTRRLLEEALGRFEVTSFRAKGEVFDPRIHEALMTSATEEVAPWTVLEEQHRGFFLHDRLIRPAAVVVAAAPRRGDGGPLPEEGGEGGAP